MSKLPAKLLIISYRTGTPGDVLAEYADDKIRFAENFKIKTFVITALGTNLLKTDSLRIFQVPSISHKDFKLELEILRNNRMPQPKWVMFYKIIPNTFGRLFDVLYKAINGESGYARWSWSISAFFASVFVKIFFSAKHCLAIGSASAYFVGLVLQKVTGIKLYVEVPDPIIGSEMIRSRFKSKLMECFERELIKCSMKYLLITRKSYIDAVQRYPKQNKHIFFHYPESWDFGIKIEKNKSSRIEIVHLGSIYDNRNLDNWFKALDELYANKSVEPENLLTINIGMSNCVHSENYLRRSDYKLIESQPREVALKIASSADYLFLLQHTDSRSSETIPYKLYDYLNLEIPIIALINNPEIHDLLRNHKDSLVANVNDIKSIQELILKLKIINDDNSHTDLKPRKLGLSFTSIFQ